MREPLSADRLAEIRAQIERAHTEVGDVCSRPPRKRFKMSVPADPERDTDLIITAALKAAEDLADEVERLRAERDRDDRETEHLIGERDELHELLDRVAYKIAPVEVIGEHSSGNDPWAHALDLITPAAEVDRLKAENEQVAAKLAAVSRVRAWTNEDGRRFVFVDDLWAALGLPAGEAVDQ
ncbi:hypothetical protein [Nonomuraea typhae]|uniref:PCRF domain-containing protein n=1 Tax=Nonomuraea typhae TaxID=2603600 RepID=A0ABW7YLQ9_9ACTN